MKSTVMMIVLFNVSGKDGNWKPDGRTVNKECYLEVLPMLSENEKEKGNLSCRKEVMNSSP